jgi:hypothetical protein
MNVLHSLHIRDLRWWWDWQGDSSAEGAPIESCISAPPNSGEI